MPTMDSKEIREDRSDSQPPCSSSTSSTSDRQWSHETDRGNTSDQPATRVKRKYRCRVRSPATVQRSRRMRRTKANARERRRMHSLNAALEVLRRMLPQIPDEPRLTKIETLRMAYSYIDALSQMLDEVGKQSSGIDANHQCLISFSGITTTSTQQMSNNDLQNCLFVNSLCTTREA